MKLFSIVRSRRWKKSHHPFSGPSANGKTVIRSLLYTYLMCLVQGAPETSDGFWNLKTSLPATQHFHTDNHCSQCCLEFSWHGNVSICVNKFFHFALKHYFISKTVRCFWCTLYCGRFQSVPKLITEIVFCWRTMYMRHRVYVPFVLPYYCCYIAPHPSLYVTLF